MPRKAIVIALVGCAVLVGWSGAARGTEGVFTGTSTDTFNLFDGPCPVRDSPDTIAILPVPHDAFEGRAYLVSLFGGAFKGDEYQTPVRGARARYSLLQVEHDLLGPSQRRVLESRVVKTDGTGFFVISKGGPQFRRLQGFGQDSSDEHNAPVYLQLEITWLNKKKVTATNAGLSLIPAE